MSKRTWLDLSALVSTVSYGSVRTHNYRGLVPCNDCCSYTEKRWNNFSVSARIRTTMRRSPAKQSCRLAWHRPLQGHHHLFLGLFVSSGSKSQVQPTTNHHGSTASPHLRIKSPAQARHPRLLAAKQRYPQTPRRSPDCFSASLAAIDTADHACDVTRPCRHNAKASHLQPVRCSERHPPLEKFTPPLPL